MPDSPSDPAERRTDRLSSPAPGAAARYGVGPSRGRSNGGASAPGVAEAVGHQGVPEEETPSVAEPSPPVRAADEAALRRVARPCRRDRVQRNERITVRFSTTEAAAIQAKARSLNIAVAHLIGSLTMAHIAEKVALPGQRTALDDYIDELAALRTQVARLGTNINQIARRLNAGASPQPGDNAVLDQTARTLEVVRAALADIDQAAHRAATHPRARQ